MRRTGQVSTGLLLIVLGLGACDENGGAGQCPSTREAVGDGVPCSLPEGKVCGYDCGGCGTYGQQSVCRNGKWVVTHPCECAGGDTGPAPDLRLHDAGTQDGRPATDAATPPTAEQVLKACTIFGSCVLGTSVSACLRDYYGKGTVIEAPVACLAQSATGCAAVKACAGIWTATGAPCTTGKTSHCVSASTAVVCDDSLGLYMDCQKLFGVGCTGTACGTGASCTGFKGCQGTNVTGCASGKAFFIEACALWGRVCKGGVCVGPEGACTTSTCQGNAAAHCVEGYVKRLLCPALGAGFTCQTTSAGAVCRQGTQCDPASTAAYCDGDQLVVCNAGLVAKVDCKALGFSGCSLTACKP